MWKTESQNEEFGSLAWPSDLRTKTRNFDFDFNFPFYCIYEKRPHNLKKVEIEIKITLKMNSRDTLLVETAGHGSPISNTVAQYWSYSSYTVES